MVSAKQKQVPSRLMAGCINTLRLIYRRDAISVCVLHAPCCTVTLILMLIAQGIYPAQNNLFCLISQSYSIMVKESHGHP